LIISGDALKKPESVIIMVTMGTETVTPIWRRKLGDIKQYLLDHVRKRAGTSRG
jgi:hypothetical protein